MSGEEFLMRIAKIEHALCIQAPSEKVRRTFRECIGDAVQQGGVTQQVAKQLYELHRIRNSIVSQPTGADKISEQHARLLSLVEQALDL